MIHVTLLIVPKLFGRWLSARLGTHVRRGALVLLSTILLLGIASAQIPTTTALPYVLTSIPGKTIIKASPPLTKIPTAVNNSPISSLLGGGFGAALNGAIAPSQAVAQAIALASLRAAEIFKKAQAAKNQINQLQADTNQARVENIDELDSELEEPGGGNCTVPLLRERFRGKHNAPRMHPRLHTSQSPRSMRSNYALRTWKPFDVGGCTLPQEDQAQEAQAQLEATTESGEASEEALESAEAAVEAAEEAAEVAEAAAEALVDGLDVLEGILDALSLI